MKTFEVELRALLTKNQHDSLLKQFSKTSKGQRDDAEVYTFLTKYMNIKIKKLVTQGKAKITVKKGAEYKQGVDETELPINPSDIQKAVKLITALGYKKHIPSIHKRTNFVIDGIQVALKHETNWKYHMEAEIVVKNEKEIESAKQKLHAFFKKLHITPMTEEQTRTLINSILVKYNIDVI